MAPKPKQYRRTFIREWRKHRDNMTLEELASKIDMVPSHLSMLERGQRGYTQDTLEKIAHALQTDTGSLLLRRPDVPHDEFQAIWDSAQPQQRRQLVEIARAITKRDE